MFEFFHKTKSGELVDLLEIIALDLEKIQLAALAREKAIGMIAKAIAKSEIVISTGKERRMDGVYFRLNILPNDNQSGTDFWYLATHKLLDTGECLVIPLAGKYYIAESWTTNNMVTYGKTYSSVSITDGTDTYSLEKIFRADEVLHFKYGTAKQRLFTEQVLRQYSEALSALVGMETLSNSPRFKYKVDANMTFAERNADGTTRKLTINEVVDRLKKQLQENGVSVIKEQTGTTLEYMKVDAKVTASEISTLADEIGKTAAMAYDIPLATYNGAITEKSDASNEFITYAVQPVAEVITDMLNAKLVGEADYIKGERVFVWLSRFKHVDVIDSASSLDKLRSIGFSFDEIREMVGYEPLNTEFSQERALTKNYATEGEEGVGSTDPADDPEESSDRNQMSKHKERRSRRYGQAPTALLAAGPGPG